MPTRPAVAKFRLVTPLLLTEPVKDRLSDRAIRGTYQSAAATTMAAIRMPPTICGAVTGRRVGPPSSATAGFAGAAADGVLPACSSASSGASCSRTWPSVTGPWS